MEKPKICALCNEKLADSEHVATDSELYHITIGKEIFHRACLRKKIKRLMPYMAVEPLNAHVRPN